MHLVHPALTTTGKKKGKKKWASAEHKRKAELARAAREAMLKEYNIKPTKKRRDDFTVIDHRPKYDHPRYVDHNEIASLNTTWEPCLKKQPLRYTGTLIKGIATMHKSNAVPVINEEEMVSISQMRRG
jgi:hypothetical protein